MSGERPDHLRLRLRLLEAVMQLPDERLHELDVFFTGQIPEPQHVISAVKPIAVPPALDWPHAPPHRLSELGTYIVTGGTHYRQHFFRGAEHLDALQSALLSRAKA